MRILRAFILILALTFIAQAQTATFYSANVNHGQGTDLVFDFQRQLTSMSDADFIAVSERTTTETGWNTPLSNTGMSQAIFVADPAGGDGQALWTRTATVTVVTTYTHVLSNTTNPTSGSSTFGWDGSTDVRRSAAAIKATVSGKTFYVVSVHLCPSRCNDSSSVTTSAQRESQITDLLSWISTTLTGFDVIVLGDFNLAPDQPKIGGGNEIDMLTAGYADLWQSGIVAGTATASWGDRDSDGFPDMPIGSLTTRTHDTRRIDYGFLKNGAATLRLSSVSVPDTRATCPHALVAGGTFPSCWPEVNGGTGVSGMQWDIPDDFGVRPSDHNWVKVVLNLSPVVVCNCHSSTRCA